jgi:uncharacterized protein (TIGR02001 family)
MRIWLLAGLIGPVLLPASEVGATGVSGSVAVVSDYRYRGISLSENMPALQGTLDIDLGKGAYGEFWASTIRDNSKLEAELAATLGGEMEVSDHLSLDLSATYYAYPASTQDNYAEATAALSATHKALTGKLGVSIAPPQRAMRDNEGRTQGNFYYFTSAEIALPRAPLKLCSQLGYERGGFDEVDHGGKWDWSIGLEAGFRNARLGLTYVDSNAGSATIVGSVGISF